MSPQLRRERNRLFLVDGCLIVIGLRTILALISRDQLLALVGFCLVLLGAVILTDWMLDWGRRVEVEKRWRK